MRYTFLVSFKKFEKSKFVNYTENGQKMSKNREKWALIKINPREFQMSFFNSVLVFRKLKQFFFTYLPVFSLSVRLHP